MKKYLVFLLLAASALAAKAQYNVERLVTSGQVALHYEDYVLAIQYFNQVIALKPFLYEPWQGRAAAKFFLDDFVGAEADATEAIILNPYIDILYDLRAIARIRQQNYAGAVADYDKAIAISPDTRNFWLNRAICLMNNKEYDKALGQTDTIARKWNRFATVYQLKAEIWLNKKDTAEAAKWIDKSLEIDPYDASTWTIKANMSLARRKWNDANAELDKAIHLKPKEVGNYINRALARLNINNLRGSMDDYDMAIDLDPNNFLAHYNRGLLRVQLGDDNRAIEDFDYVIRMEPHNYMAIFNRGSLNEKTGNIRGAIRDYTTVIDQFPDFWTGLNSRARCYRKLGMTAKAEADEFRILKAQMDKHLGKQKRWSKDKLKEMRKRSEIDPEKYNQIVVADSADVGPEYKSEYRGRVQNRRVDTTFKPMFCLAFDSYSNGIKQFQAYDTNVEEYNAKSNPIRRLYLNCGIKQLSLDESKNLFTHIDLLSARIAAAPAVADAIPSLVERAVAYSVVQNFDAAINDLTVCLAADSTNVLAYWQRAVCQTMLNSYEASHGADVRMMSAKAEADFNAAIKLAGENAFLYFDRGNMHIATKDYGKAIDDYTRALAVDPTFAEAYFNRGMAYIMSGNKVGAIADLSKAGEQGLYEAYSIIKQQQKAK